jgi:hypothetical protein
VTGVDHRGALEAVERILNRGGEPTEVVAAVLAALQARGIEYGVVRPRAGEPIEAGSPRGGISATISRDGAEAGTLELSVTDRAFVERVATLISPYLPRQ